MDMIKNTKKMVDVVKKYDETLRNNNSLYKHYFAPDLPEKLIQKLLRNFDNLMAINSLIAFYDTTLFSTAKAGLLFATEGFYYKDLGKTFYFTYSDIIKTSISGDSLVLKLNCVSMDEYTIITVLDSKSLKLILDELIKISTVYALDPIKPTGKIEKLNLPPDKQKRCHEIIHVASAACGGVGTGLAQIPASDNAVIVPIQVGMIVALGSVFELNITESVAKSIIASAASTIAGRTISQFLIGWVPIIGNAINTATAAGVTEVIGWIAAKNFYARWVHDQNKGRYKGMKDGYNEASREYELKLKKQADEFLSQKNLWERNLDEYEKLLNEYEKLLDEYEKMLDVPPEIISRTKDTYYKLKALQQGETK